MSTIVASWPGRSRRWPEGSLRSPGATATTCPRVGKARSWPGTSWRSAAPLRWGGSVPPAVAGSAAPAARRPRDGDQSHLCRRHAATRSGPRAWSHQDRSLVGLHSERPAFRRQCTAGRVCHYAPDRTGARLAEPLRQFRGILQVDGYAGFEALAQDGIIALAACWAHARRRLFEMHKAESPLATEAVQRICQIKADARGLPPDERRRVRGERSKPECLVQNRPGRINKSCMPGVMLACCDGQYASVPMGWVSTG
jgi:hypothetical protein